MKHYLKTIQNISEKEVYIQRSCGEYDFKKKKRIRISKSNMGDIVMKTLIILYSYHHNNTEKIANIIANVLNAQIKKPQEINPEELQEYDLIGFGSGIYSAKHHESLLDLADKLPQVRNNKVFLFSTGALTSEKKVIKDHSKLKEKLQSKGYKILNDFQCKGFNTNSFMKYLGGMNKGRPNADDLYHAEEFAKSLKINAIKSLH